MTDPAKPALSKKVDVCPTCGAIVKNPPVPALGVPCGDSWHKPALSVEQEARTEFEHQVRTDPHWMNSADWLMRLDVNGQYVDVGVDLAWVYWQASRRQTLEEVIRMLNWHGLLELADELEAELKKGHRATAQSESVSELSSPPIGVDLPDAAPLAEDSITPHCAMCNWEPDEPDEGDHTPTIHIAGNGHLCAECVSRCKTVSAFGLTVSELEHAAALYKTSKELKKGTP